jgi:chitinase
MKFSQSYLLILALAGLSPLTGCGGGSAKNAPPQPEIFVIINLPTANVPQGGTQTFAATVAGSSDKQVNWSVQEGAAGGTIDNSGNYIAPNAAGTFHVIATSRADSSKSKAATVLIRQAILSVGQET